MIFSFCINNNPKKFINKARVTFAPKIPHHGISVPPFSLGGAKLSHYQDFSESTL
jgi:hypothetical protein